MNKKISSNSYQLKLTNVSCASCVKTIESTLNSLPGMQTANVNFAERTVMIEGTTSIRNAIQALKKAGYIATLYQSN